MTSKYESLTHAQLVELLEKRDRTKKLGLVWERDEIAADAAVDENFVACEIVPNLSDKAAPWGNIVIEGDNFDALRWLRMTHAGAVKCIYIDPPYNTGNKDWVYNDAYVDKEDRYRHSTWLEFLYRRLTLARDLLAEDGVLLVSINDDQRAKLELMMDEALPGMRVGSFAWRTRTGGNDTKGSFLSENHEHVLVYAKKNFKFGGYEKTFEKYVFWDESKKDHFRLSDISQPKDMTERLNGFYAMYDPNADVYYPANPQRVWPSPFPKGTKYRAEDYPDIMPVFPPDAGTKGILPPKDQIGQWIKQGRIVFPLEQRITVWNTRDELIAAIEMSDVPMAKKTKKIWHDMPFLDFWIGKKVGFGIPQWVRYKRELKNSTQPVSSWITPQSEAATLPVSEAGESPSNLLIGMNQEGTTEVQDIFGYKAFTYTKPVSLIRELVRQASGEGDLVLDFFAGSATTAQAVMELNAGEGTDRRFILVSSTEATKDGPSKNLCRDVTAERIRRLNASTDPKYDGLVAGFAYLRTKEIKFEDLDYDLLPADAWTALEALHGLPLTLHNPSRSWNVHETDAVTLVLADRFDPALIEWLRPRDRQNLFVYAWAPGQIVAALEGLHIEVLPVRETLVRKYQQ
ncbi:MULTISPECIES: site-specific DNA-methyltransferase [unclassified Yoonia]|uniref:site-specific DNA-methyltransferase n=1 Tax=unclassified Yoonia TaxID=2629118 RepID=UPI002AFE5BF0|nr:MULTISPECIES: site-specific DNA-methyltransferase [unclassified Yoonia]